MLFVELKVVLTDVDIDGAQERINAFDNPERVMGIESWWMRFDAVITE